MVSSFQAPSKGLFFRDTPFAELMNRRIYNVLLIATKYDAFMLEDDGRVDEQIFNEYTALNLRYPPRFTRVATEEEALARLEERNFELVIVMPNMAGRDIFTAAAEIKIRHPHIPIVVLTPFSKEVSRRVAGQDLSNIDYIFSWLGNSELLLAIIKLIEDKLNAPHDMAEVGVQTILLVEDSIRFYSSALPHLYHLVLEQSQIFAEEALNDHLKMLRMRGRPKIMLARTYEEATEILQTYPNNILGVISDMSFVREGKKDPLAGFRLGKLLREIDAHIPLILESSELANEQYAQKLKASFLGKQSKSYPQDLRREIMRRFGFGPFIIRDPDTEEEIFRIHDLKDLQQKIFQIPDNALRRHLSHNHFSRFFYSRAMFPPAEILKLRDVSEYSDMDEARKFIFDIIVNYRKMKNEGVVAIYRKDRFDEYSHFARIGDGSLGGKGRGLAFISSMLRGMQPTFATDTFHVDIPRTVVICTDIFDDFMERNELYPLALSDATDEEILAAFERGSLSEQVTEDLQSLFRVVTRPVAVRSSSILEDSHYQPFAGVYSTYMVPHVNNSGTMLELLRSAIKAVYASVFYKDSKAYLTATQNLIDQEKMAVVLQEVVGSEHESLFFPTLSGVARSLNFYPVGAEKTEEGIAQLAIGLGKYIVDGGQALRFSPAHPKHILQLGSVECALRETQKHFLALDLKNLPTTFRTDDAFNLVKIPLSRCPSSDPVLRFVLSTYDLLNNRLGAYAPRTRGRSVCTFAGILQHDSFPLAECIRTLLDVGTYEMGRPVEIEFALQIHDVGSHAEAWFYLLQIRPIVDRTEDVDFNFEPKEDERILVRSSSVLGNGRVTDAEAVVYIKSKAFDASHTAEIATELAKINEDFLKRESGYVLVGPGRWGSSDPWLGIPVKWAHISCARAIVECQLPNYKVEASQGTHFFQNLTSLGVGYFTLSQPAPGISLENTPSQKFDEAWLDSCEAVYESSFVRVVRFDKGLEICMNGKHQRGFIAVGK